MKIEVIGNNIFINDDEWVKKEQPTPKDGEVMFIEIEIHRNAEWLFIYKAGFEQTSFYVGACINSNYIDTTSPKICYTSRIKNLRPATPEDAALLHSKLAENGKVWNAEKKVLEDLPKPLKEGDLAIFWDDHKDTAIIGSYLYCGQSIYSPFNQIRFGGIQYKNAIPFESIEQYLEFIKS